MDSAIGITVHDERLLTGNRMPDQGAVGESAAVGSIDHGDDERGFDDAQWPDTRDDPIPPTFPRGNRSRTICGIDPKTTALLDLPIQHIDPDPLPQFLAAAEWHRDTEPPIPGEDGGPVAFGGRGNPGPGVGEWRTVGHRSDTNRSARNVESPQRIYLGAFRMSR